MRQIEGLLFLAGWLLGGEGMNGDGRYKMTDEGWIAFFDVKDGFVVATDDSGHSNLVGMTMDDVKRLAELQHFVVRKVE